MNNVFSKEINLSIKLKREERVTMENKESFRKLAGLITMLVISLLSVIAVGAMEILVAVLGIFWGLIRDQYPKWALFPLTKVCYKRYARYFEAIQAL